jgi:hypothetical protein
LRRIERIRMAATRHGGRSRLRRSRRHRRRPDRRHGRWRRCCRHPRSTPASHFVERGLEELVPVLKLLYIAGQLTDLILQAFDPVQKVCRTGLGMRRRRGGQAAPQKDARK